MSLMVSKKEKRIPFAQRAELIKAAEEWINAAFEELHHLYYDGLSEAETRRLQNIVESDGKSHYSIPK